MFILYILAIVYVLGWLYILKEGIMTLIPAVKCREMSLCKKDDCPFRSYCSHTALSDKEIKEIREQIESL